MARKQSGTWRTHLLLNAACSAEKMLGDAAGWDSNPVLVHLHEDASGLMSCSSPIDADAWPGKRAGDVLRGFAKYLESNDAYHHARQTLPAPFVGVLLYVTAWATATPPPDEDERPHGWIANSPGAFEIRSVMGMLLSGQSVVVTRLRHEPAQLKVETNPDLAGDTTHGLKTYMDAMSAYLKVMS